MQAIQRHSPNHDARKANNVQMLVLHYTGMQTAMEALDRMCDKAAKVSAHYMIDEDGTVHALVDEKRRAWHAGESCWKGQTDINSLSIGIELVNPGHEFGYRDFPEPQMAALVELAQAILSRHPIRPEYVLGHSDVAPQRKTDPGELFHWSRLASAGVGLWPFKEAAIGAPGGPMLAAGAQGQEVAAAQNLLKTFGYEVPVNGVLDSETMLVVKAFQRHFRPAGISGHLDTETVGRLLELVTAVG